MKQTKINPLTSNIAILQAGLMAAIENRQNGFVRHETLGSVLKAIELCIELDLAPPVIDLAKRKPVTSDEGLTRGFEPGSWAHYGIHYQDITKYTQSGRETQGLHWIDARIPELANMMAHLKESIKTARKAESAKWNATKANHAAYTRMKELAGENPDVPAQTLSEDTNYLRLRAEADRLQRIAGSYAPHRPGDDLQEEKDALQREYNNLRRFRPFFRSLLEDVENGLIAAVSTLTKAAKHLPTAPVEKEKPTTTTKRLTPDGIDKVLEQLTENDKSTARRFAAARRALELLHVDRIARDGDEYSPEEVKAMGRRVHSYIVLTYSKENPTQEIVVCVRQADTWMTQTFAGIDAQANEMRRKTATPKARARREAHKSDIANTAMSAAEEDLKTEAKKPPHKKFVPATAVRFVELRVIKYQKPDKEGNKLSFEDAVEKAEGELKQLIHVTHPAAGITYSDEEVDQLLYGQLTKLLESMAPVEKEEAAEVEDDEIIYSVIDEPAEKQTTEATEHAPADLEPTQKKPSDVPPKPDTGNGSSTGFRNDVLGTKLRGFQMALNGGRLPPPAQA